MMGFLGVSNTVLYLMGGNLVLLFLFLFLVIFLVYLAKRTHMIEEFKGIRSGKPICLFFDETNQVEWKPLENKAGLVQDDVYGTYIVNPKGSYTDKRTKATIIPFSASVASNANLQAFKAADDINKITKDEKQMTHIRNEIAEGKYDGWTFSALTESVDMNSIKSMMNTMLPHNITNKINMMVADRLNKGNKPDMMMITLYIAGLFGAIIMAYMVIKMAAV